MPPRDWQFPDREFRRTIQRPSYYRRLRRALIRLSTTTDSLLAVLAELEAIGAGQRLLRDDDVEWEQRPWPGGRPRRYGPSAADENGEWERRPWPGGRPRRYGPSAADESGEWERRPWPRGRPRRDRESPGNENIEREGERKRWQEGWPRRYAQDAADEAIDLAAIRDAIERLYELGKQITRDQ